MQDVEAGVLVVARDAETGVVVDAGIVEHLASRRNDRQSWAAGQTTLSPQLTYYAEPS